MKNKRADNCILLRIFLQDYVAFAVAIEAVLDGDEIVLIIDLDDIRVVEEEAQTDPAPVADWTLERELHIGVV